MMLLLTGCTTAPSVAPQILTHPPPPANLTVKCDPISALNVKSTLGDLVKYTIELMTQYNECALRNDSLIDSLTSRDAANGK